MKVIVARDGVCYEAKNLPLGMAAPAGMICDMNPNTANNWLIPAGIVFPVTEETIKKVQKMMEEKE